MSDRSGTIPGLVAGAAARDPDGVWLRTDAGSLTFAQAAAAIGRAAGHLAEAGVGQGDRVMLIARNTPPCLITWLALTTLGAVAVPVNPRSAPPELAGLAGQADPKLIVADIDMAPDLPTGRRMLGTAAVAGDWRHPAPADLPDARVRPDDLAVLLPTSGTTARPKLVMQTHRAYAMAGEGFPHWLGLTREDRLMTSLPLFHINAPAYSVMGSLACGAGLILLPRFSAGTFLESARRHGATEFNAIGAMLEILMRRPELRDDAATPLRLCYTGPAPPKDRQLEIERRFGIEIVVGYALSESPYGLIWPRGERPYGTLGRPRQHPTLGTVNRARVVDGELWLRNPAVTPGYWDMPEETSRTIEDGWLRTGDLVTANPDGTYTFVGRRKEVLRRRGENISPLEVEEVLEAHPGVLECAVVGVPSELSEEEVKAFVVLRDDGLDLAELRAWTAGRLAAFKVPRYWQVLDELPRTPTARVAKHLLPAGHRPEEIDLR